MVATAAALLDELQRGLVAEQRVRDGRAAAEAKRLARLAILDFRVVEDGWRKGRAGHHGRAHTLVVHPVRHRLHGASQLWART